MTKGADHFVHGVLGRYVLPDAQDLPARLSQSGILPLVASPVACELRIPVLDVRAR